MFARLENPAISDAFSKPARQAFGAKPNRKYRRGSNPISSMTALGA
jgi:hypothetical protein